MTKYTQKQLKELVKNGVAVDVTNARGVGYWYYIYVATQAEC